MQDRVILLIIPLLLVVQSAEAANYTTTITTTVTIVQPQQENENFSKYNTSTGGGSGNTNTETVKEIQQENTVETSEETQQENIPTETIGKTPSQKRTSTLSTAGSSTQLIQTSFSGVGLTHIQQGGELQYLTTNRIKMPEFESNPVSVIAEPEVIAPLAAAVGVGIVSAFPIKPVGFSAASVKTFRVAVMYRRSTLFSKTQTVFALAFLSLAFASLSAFMNMEIVSLILFPAFFGLVVYHNTLWYARYSYSRVDTMSRQVLMILPVIGLLGYLHLLFTEAIPFDLLQTIVVAGMLAVIPSTIFTALSFRGSRLEAKWMLVTVGLAAVMSGIILSTEFMISTLALGDVLVMAGCGLVVWGQYNLSTKYSTK